MTTLQFSIDQMLGFFDADGSFEAKVRVGKQKPISFHVNVIFSQKDEDVLQAVIDTLSVGTKTVSARQITNASGTQSIGRSISLAFSSTGGKTLLNAWATNPPKAPTKFLDYKIATILAEVSATQNSTALGVVKKYLQPNSNVIPQDELTASLGLLWLRYQMFGKVKSNKNPNLKKIEVFYHETGATQAQIDQSIKIGQELFEPIQQELQKHTAELLKPTSKLVNISDDYLLGYHIGDGSFQIQTEFLKNNTVFKSHFNWTLTDCNENKPLLEAVQHYLTNKGLQNISVEHKSTYVRLNLSNKSGCLALVQLWAGKSLPNTRLNQYDCFVKALNLYDRTNLKANLAQAEEFINLKWNMNPATNSKKSGALTKDLDNIRDWFNK